MKKTLGGDRLGSGKRMQVELHGYERSTHDLGNIVRTTMAAGTLVPFMVQVGLPGDTFDISLDTIVKTHPTIGPLFGSYKIQLDVFMAPIRLYQGKLHNNTLGVGMNMQSIKLPRIELYAQPVNNAATDIDNSQINPSCILSYLGIRGVGMNTTEAIQTRYFNALSFLMYWDVYKNYYANKQEEVGAVIHTPKQAPSVLASIELNGTPVPQVPSSGVLSMSPGQELVVVGATVLPDLTTIKVNLAMQGTKTLAQLGEPVFFISWSQTGALEWTGHVNGTDVLLSWDYQAADDLPFVSPEVVMFPLENIDKMRENILADAVNPGPYRINDLNLEPYNYIALLSPPSSADDIPYQQTQEGLAIKTYQSDLFNNWLQTDWIDGVDGITAITSVDTSGGSFSIDQLNLSKKVYDMLNRIAVSGGSYDDWIDAVYTHDRFTRIESPVYMGGLIKELAFEEVVSNSTTETTADGAQPLGTLAGKGRMTGKHKGGNVYIKCDEPCYIMGIISLTPRIDYSQGNSWDVHLATMDDFHKPALDQIGFQELITEQLAWWDTEYAGTPGTWTTKSAGKQPAWINYMTNVNKTYGNFAIQSNEMFMTLNRRYEYDDPGIGDLTTYIDPVKFNNIFAQTSIDAQNFWAQIAVDITARRKMSAKIMPNL